MPSVYCPLAPTLHAVVMQNTPIVVGASAPRAIFAPLNLQL